MGSILGGKGLIEKLSNPTGGFPSQFNVCLWKLTVNRSLIASGSTDKIMARMLVLECQKCGLESCSGGVIFPSFAQTFFMSDYERG